MKTRTKGILATAGVLGLIASPEVYQEIHKRQFYTAPEPELSAELKGAALANALADPSRHAEIAVVYRRAGSRNYTDQTTREDVVHVANQDAVEYQFFKAGSDKVTTGPKGFTINGSTIATDLPPLYLLVQDGDGKITPKYSSLVPTFQSFLSRQRFPKEPGLVEKKVNEFCEAENEVLRREMKPQSDGNSGRQSVAVQRTNANQEQGRRMHSRMSRSNHK